jgi:hypothetical protein
MVIRQKSVWHVVGPLNGVASGLVIGKTSSTAVTVVAHRVRSPKYVRTDVTTSHHNWE